MVWPGEQFRLPLMVSFSLMGVSATVLYYIYKKEEEHDSCEKRTINHIETSRQNELVTKVAREHVPVVIGRGGKTVKDIQNRTSTQIRFSEDDLKCSHREITIRGTMEGILLADKMIKSLIDSQPVIETYETYVPQMACGRIMGRCGQGIRKLQEDTNTKIIIEGPSCINRNRRVIIKGTADGISTALALIEEKVLDEQEYSSHYSNLTRHNLESDLTSHSSEISSEDSIEVFVSAVDDPNRFWIQLVGPGTKALTVLVSEMTDFYSEEEKSQMYTLTEVTRGQKVAAQLANDRMWYRAQIISDPVDDHCEVFFTDYGDRSTVSLEHIRRLRTDFLSLRKQAIECTLNHVRPRGNVWSTEALTRFDQLVWVAKWVPLMAKITGYKERVPDSTAPCESTCVPCVELFDENRQERNIKQQLIVEGYAVSDSEYWSDEDVPCKPLTDLLEINTPTKAALNNNTLVGSEASWVAHPEIGKDDVETLNIDIR